MTLVIEGHSFHYEMENLCRIFYPQEKINVVTEPNDDCRSRLHRAESKRPDGSALLTVRLKIGDSVKSSGVLLPAGTEEEETKRRMAVALWQMLSEEAWLPSQVGHSDGCAARSSFSEGLPQSTGKRRLRSCFREKLLVSAEKDGTCPRDVGKRKENSCPVATGMHSASIFPFRFARRGAPTVRLFLPLWKRHSA